MVHTVLGWLGPLGEREEPVKEERHGFKTLTGVCSAEMGEVQEETRHGIEAEARWPAVKTHSYCYFSLRTEAGGVKSHPKSLSEKKEILRMPPFLQAMPLPWSKPALSPELGALEDPP